MTWYLKYRPQKLSELDTKVVREALINILSTKNIPHAFLLLGSRGLGKTSTARIIAKSVNCPNTKNGEPCGECEICTSITDGSCPDVIEIDAASNRGIDDVREIRERAKLTPLMAAKKVYIIDEVHMLTTEAANALLKILEEPPQNTMFILCTTEAHKIPQTVASRCMVVQFSQPTLADLTDKLKTICKSENLKFGDVDLSAIARIAKGSFRDAIKLLEQAALSGMSIDTLTGLSSVSAEDFLQAVDTGKRDVALGYVDKIQQQGVSVPMFIEQCMWVLRDKLFSSQSKGVVISMLESLAEAYVQSKSAAVVQLPLEIWVIKNTLRTDEHKPVVSKDTPPSAGESATVHVKATVLKDAELVVKPQVELKPETINADEVSTEVASEKLIKPDGVDKLADLVPMWPEILRVVKQQNNSVEALLRSTRPAQFGDGYLVLEVFYAFHKDKLDSEKCRLLVESAVKQVVGEKVKLRLVMSSKKTVASDISGVVGEDIVAAAAEIFKVETI